MDTQNSNNETNKHLIAKIFLAGFIRFFTVIGVALALCALLWGLVNTLTYFVHLLMLGDKKPVLGCEILDASCYDPSDYHPIVAWIYLAFSVLFFIFGTGSRVIDAKHPEAAQLPEDQDQDR